MKATRLILVGALISTVAFTSLAGTVLAWHPKGAITKKVQNITAASAVAAKPGDILKYVIEVRNDGSPASNGYNDMDKTTMTDTLPAGVELVGNYTTRQITESLGLLKPGQKVTKEYTVKVTAHKNGTITNTACFTGDSTANDNPQEGCNPAVITVTVPPVVSEPPVTPKPPIVSQPPAVTPHAPVELPHTGPTENILVSMLAIGIAFYTAQRYLQSKRALTNALYDRK